MAGYTVRVADNYHYMDESETYTLGVFSTIEEAIAQCRSIVDRSLSEQLKPGITADELYQQYIAFGDDPFVLEDQRPGRFSAWEYARERSVAMTSPPPTGTEALESERRDTGRDPETEVRRAWTILGSVTVLVWLGCLLCLWGMFQPALMDARDGFSAVAGRVPVFSASTAFSILVAVSGALALVPRASTPSSRRFVAGTWGWLGSMVTFFMMLPGRQSTTPLLEYRMFAFYLIPILVMLGARAVVEPLRLLACVPRVEQKPD